MSRYRLELAGPNDDSDLRAVLAATPMPGVVSVVFRREPSYFAAAVVDGRFRQVIAARDETSRRIVAFGSRSVGMRYVNGQPMPVGYLSGLRILPEHRDATLLARGYAFLRTLHEDGRTPLYLTTIAGDNHIAHTALLGGRAGLPTYHFAGHYHTAAVRMDVATRLGDRDDAVRVRPAVADDLSGFMEFVQQAGRRRQFFPCYEARDFFNDEGAFRGMAAEDLWLAYRHGRLVGTLGGWDQHAFRQMRVHSYGGLIRWIRPLYNAWARARGRPRLPRPNESIRCLTAAIPLVLDDDPVVFEKLLRLMIESKRRGPWKYALLGMHESEPLLAVVRRLPATWYTTNLYLACWEDGDRPRAGLDQRPIYLELGSL